jgi:hypothetical protein
MPAGNAACGAAAFEDGFGFKASGDYPVILEKTDG